MVSQDDDEVYNNPDDNYKPSSNVENGAAIGKNFDTTADYLSTVLVKPILLFCLGFVPLWVESWTML